MRHTHSPCHDPRDSEPLGNTGVQLSLSLSTLTSYTAVPSQSAESPPANKRPSCVSVDQSEDNERRALAMGDLLLLISPDIDTHVPPCPRADYSSHYAGSAIKWLRLDPTESNVRIESDESVV